MERENREDPNSILEYGIIEPYVTVFLNHMYRCFVTLTTYKWENL
jgi:hypothetical protein